MRKSPDKSDPGNNAAKNVPLENIKIRSSADLTNIQKFVAARMVKTLSIPQLLQTVKADTTSLLSLKEKMKQDILSSRGISISYTDFLIKICSSALKEYIELNSSYSNEKYIIYDDINIGLAISVNSDLIVGTLYNAEKLDICEIAKKRMELVQKAETQTLSMADVKYSTFTITNVGMYGIRSTYALINPPQAAILAAGEVYIEPAIVDGKVLPRSFIEVSLSADHRIINGALSAKFLQRIAYFIENPAILFQK
jgi:pyruvate/2-oxoglutarate dehydrogenase complex dihydrolipoamide acyltransferase (E2) component